MVENVLSRMGGVSMYGIISICLFFAVFIGVLIWMVGLKKSYIEEMRELPLDGASGPESDAHLTPNPENQHD
jgi:hypothetical protein